MRGRVLFDGAAPPRVTRDVSVDAELCGDAPVVDRSMLVDPATAGVRWAVVTLSSPDHPAPPPVTATLDQARCEYHPFVTVVSPGSRVVIANADDGLHDVHVFRKASDSNHTLPPDGRVELALPETGNVLLGCDLHYWSRAWVVVSDAAFSAITDAQGRFEITGVPPGAWQLSVWHERLGITLREIVVPDTGAAIREDIKLPPPPRSKQPAPATSPAAPP